MDIKMMHEMIEKLTECAKHEIDKGIETVDTKEMGEVTDIIKDLAEAMYYRTLVEAMKESEYGEDYDYMGAYDDGRRGYRGQPRDSMGRYTSRRRGGRRMGYEEPPYYHMTPDMYHDWDNMTEAERMRDLDRPSMNRMYYSGSGSSGQSTGGSGMSGGNMGGYDGNRGDGRDSREGRSGSARRGYIETKEMGKDKQEKMKELENYMKELSSDVTEMISDASPEEKTMLKNKMQVLMTKIQ